MLSRLNGKAKIRLRVELDVRKTNFGGAASAPLTVVTQEPPSVATLAVRKEKLRRRFESKHEAAEVRESRALNACKWDWHPQGYIRWWEGVNGALVTECVTIDRQFPGASHCA